MVLSGAIERKERLWSAPNHSNLEREPEQAARHFPVDMDPSFAGGPGFVMPWIIGFKKARERLSLGDTIDAQTALDLGMVNRVVPRERLAEATDKPARRLALIAPEALAATGHLQ